MFGFAKGAPDEDRLTAALFGLMHYLADPELLHPFLEALGKANPSFEWSNAHLPEEAEVFPWPTLEVPGHMATRFARVEGGAKGSVTPDALIRLFWPRWGLERRPRTVWVYVESEHSKAVEAEQLAQQLVVLDAEHGDSDEVWLLLLNSTPVLPWPEGSRPRLWPGADPGLARRDLAAWCRYRAHYLRTGQPGPDHSREALLRPRLLHYSWQDCADLVLSLERRSWAYRSLLAGLRDYLATAGYFAAVTWFEVVEHAPDAPIDDRHATIAGRRPNLFPTEPDDLFARVGNTYIGAGP